LNEIRGTKPAELYRRIWGELERGGAPVSAGAVVDQIRAIHALRAQLDVEEGLAAHDLRSLHGWSWDRIAKVCGGTADDVRARFSGVEVVARVNDVEQPP
jgi:hypothetical protein